MRVVWDIFVKELVETLRDRRTLVFMIVLPTVIVPGLMWAMLKASTMVLRANQEKEHEVAIYNAEAWPELVEAYRGEGKLILREDVPRDMMNNAIRTEKISAAVVIPRDFQKLMESEMKAQVHIVYDDAEPNNVLFERLSGPIEEFAEQERDRRLAALGVNGRMGREALLNPIVAKKDGLATQRERLGEIVGGFLPYMFIAFAFIGAMYPAIDLGAGEKERTTLETLLIAPVGRFQLVLGKYFVVALSAVTSAVLAILSLLASTRMMLSENDEGGRLAEVLSAIGLKEMLYTGTLILPLAALFAALLLSVSIYAKSFKEAQNYISPLSYLIILPALFSMIPGLELNGKTALVPILNVSLASKEILKGTLDPFYYFLILFSTVLLAGVGLALCSRWFRKEFVLFRS